MKGDSMSTWIWIIGGVIMAAILILVAQGSILQLWTHTDRQNVVSDFNGLKSDIEGVCGQAPGGKTTSKVNLNGVQALFVSENRSTAPTESPVYISNSKTSRGRYLCMSFEDKHHGCAEIGCQANMTWVGKPLEGTDLYTLAQESGYNFEAKISKKRSGNVRVKWSIAP